MDTSVERSFGLARIASAAIEGDDLALCLSDGRTLTVPLAWFPKLLNASPEERRRFRLIGKGVGIHWSVGPTLTIYLGR